VEIESERSARDRELNMFGGAGAPLIPDIGMSGHELS